MKQRGFSLIELMVAVGILTLINIMIFASYPEFSQRIALRRTSEEIALIVRQAQAYSLGIKKPVSGGDEYYGFGVHFDKSQPNSKSIILFTDSDGDGKYSGELFQEFKIDTGVYVYDLQTCDSSKNCSSIVDTVLDVFYPRASSFSLIDGGTSNASYAQIRIKSPRGDASKNKKDIEIWTNGQISVKDPP